jgi:hypothetical protein
MSVYLNTCMYKTSGVHCHKRMTIGVLKPCIDLHDVYLVILDVANNRHIDVYTSII